MDRITILDGSVAHFPSLFRRLSRIFSHAYYSHRELFQLAEVETSLYARFVALCEKYDLVGSNLLVIPRRVVADTIDGKLDHEDDDSEEDELDDEDLDVEEEEDRGSRRREKDEEGGRRPHSLDRHARPHKFDDLRQKVDAGVGATGGGTVKGKPDDPDPRSEPKQGPEPMVDTPSTSTSTATMAQSPMNPDPISLSTTKTYSLKPRSKSDKDKINNSSTTGTLGRSTLGKKSRGTMLWSSDTPSSTPTTQEQGASTPIAEIGQPLERTESTETAIHTLSEEDLEGEGPVDPSQVDLVHETETETEAQAEKADGQNEKDGVEEVEGEGEGVPKDEIELLEEEGVLDSGKEDTVSPLPVPTTDSTTDANTSGSADLTNPHSESDKKDEVGVESTEAESKVEDQPETLPTESGSEPEAVPAKEESSTIESTSTSSSASGAATDKDTALSSNTPGTSVPPTATSDLAGKEKKDKSKVKGKKDGK